MCSDVLRYIMTLSYAYNAHSIPGTRNIVNVNVGRSSPNNTPLGNSSLDIASARNIIVNFNRKCSSLKVIPEEKYIWGWQNTAESAYK